VHTCTSADDGVTWTEPVAMPLPNNNKGVAAAVLGAVAADAAGFRGSGGGGDSSDGGKGGGEGEGGFSLDSSRQLSDAQPIRGWRIRRKGESTAGYYVVLVFNNIAGGKRFNPLSAAVSADGGTTWPWVRDLEVRAKHSKSKPNIPPLRMPECLKS